ncbi:helix-turn-helix domain-containing protein [Krasilnikovia sp. M28-CT-15]|uniref:helix-turn-helix domain-containing protein n=1 Tax=Krasilnikovia sp. M28-CT-15 TaxID=3373540 RepID=UPI0038778E48
MPGHAAPADPRFGVELRRLRAGRDLSIRDLAKRAHYGKTYIHDLETGKARPSAAVAAHLDATLETDGTLSALVREPGYGLSPDDWNRLDAVAACPRRVDRATVDALAGVLSQTRRLEDALGIGAVLAPVTACHRATGPGRRSAGPRGRAGGRGGQR